MELTVMVQDIHRLNHELERFERKYGIMSDRFHPNDPTLASTDPHHNHIPPDIKHYRVPAPGLSFDFPNLPFLIAEIERELLGH